MSRVWDVPVPDTTRVRDVLVATEAACARAGLDARRTAAAVQVATELATNALQHAGGGHTVIHLVAPPDAEPRTDEAWVQIASLDHGPGIGDVRAALRDGFTTRPASRGAGLGECLRQANAFDLYGRPDRGTVAVARVGPLPAVRVGPREAAPPPAESTGSRPAVGVGPTPAEGTGPRPAVGAGQPPADGTGPRPAVSTGPPPAEGTGTPPVARQAVPPGRHTRERVGGLNVPLGLAEHSGDAFTWVRSGTRLTMMLADGLGHGPKAAHASTTAVAQLRRTAGLPPDEILRGLHTALRPTRGAAVAVGQLDESTGLFTFCGVGNVGARLRVGDSWQSLLSHPGIVGAHFPARLPVRRTPWQSDSLFLLHSDGLPGRWTPPTDPRLFAHDPAVIAASVVRDARGAGRPLRDDTSVAVLVPER
ncbi:SpoIIE family protein phosphatase [Streptomyces sp. NPDC028635]|uniref:SpoIIE family protein phosphatase n=1 Tax=Streptomyces sp. NPDC028635 TaxID=3154800 RepID=UPI0033F5A4EF